MKTDDTERKVITIRRLQESDVEAIAGIEADSFSMPGLRRILRICLREIIVLIWWQRLMVS